VKVDGKDNKAFGIVEFKYPRGCKKALSEKTHILGNDVTLRILPFKDQAKKNSHTARTSIQKSIELVDQKDNEINARKKKEGSLSLISLLVENEKVSNILSEERSTNKISSLDCLRDENAKNNRFSHQVVSNTSQIWRPNSESTNCKVVYQPKDILEDVCVPYQPHVVFRYQNKYPAFAIQQQTVVLPYKTSLKEHIVLRTLMVLS